MIRLVCPIEIRHGAVIALAGNPRWGFHCPHTDHDGRLRSHPLGEAPRTRSFFTTAEIEAGPAPRSAADHDSTAGGFGAAGARGDGGRPRPRVPDGARPAADGPSLPQPVNR